MVTDPVCICLCTAPAEAAAGLARALVTARVVACVNVVPGLTSVYYWQDSLCEDHESLLVMKTTQGRVEALRTRLLALHPYDVPEFLVVGIDNTESFAGYLDWVRAEVTD